MVIQKLRVFVPEDYVLSAIAVIPLNGILIPLLSFLAVRKKTWLPALGIIYRMLCLRHVSQKQPISSYNPNGFVKPVHLVCNSMTSLARFCPNKNFHKFTRFLIFCLYAENKMVSIEYTLFLYSLRRSAVADVLTT